MQGTEYGGASARCHVVGSLCTTNVVSSDVAADCFDLSVDNDMSGNASLDAHDGASPFTFMSSHELATVASRCLDLSCLSLSFVTRRLDRGGSENESLLDLIGHLRA